MSKRKTHDLSFYQGSYQNGQGETKHSRLRCGKVFTDDQGRMSLLLESIPVGVSTEKGGIWFDIYPDQPRQQQQDAGYPVQPSDPMESDIPY